MEEVWKNIIGNEDKYQISSFGRLKIKNRTYITKTGVKKEVQQSIKIPNDKGLLFIGKHPYNVKSLLLQYFPEQYVEKFIFENTKEGEIWKDVKDYEGYYKVSNFGRIMSLPRITGTKVVRGITCPKIKLGQIMKPTKIGTPDKSGIYRLGVVFFKNNKTDKKLVNRLVAEAFIPNPKNLPEVNHKNRDVTDNSVSNLEWVSSEFNMQHALLSRDAVVALYKLAQLKNLTPSEMVLDLINNYNK